MKTLNALRIFGLICMYFGILLCLVNVFMLSWPLSLSFIGAIVGMFGALFSRWAENEIEIKKRMMKWHNYTNTELDE